MPARKLITRAAAAVLLLANIAVIGVASAADNNRPVNTPTTLGDIQVGSSVARPAAAAEDQAGLARSTAATPANIGAAAPGQPGVFEPGALPFAQAGVAGDGVTAWGVAYREVPNATTEPDSALVKSAFEDAHKRAQALASAVGVKLGDLVAVSDQAANQPFYGDCVKILPAPAGPEGAIPGGSAQGAGATGSGAVAPDAQVTMVAPVPPCAEKHYAVAWVLVRYHFG